MLQRQQSCSRQAEYSTEQPPWLGPPLHWLGRGELVSWRPNGWGRRGRAGFGGRTSPLSFRAQPSPLVAGVGLAAGRGRTPVVAVHAGRQVEAGVLGRFSGSSAVTAASQKRVGRRRVCHDHHALVEDAAAHEWCPDLLQLLQQDGRQVGVPVQGQQACSIQWGTSSPTSGGER